MILSCKHQAASFKLQAASLTGTVGSCRMYLERNNMNKEIYDLEQLVHKRTYRTGEVTQLRRIADSLDEILRLIKADQEQYKKKSKDEEKN